jgi:hypothetical protein
MDVLLLLNVFTGLLPSNGYTCHNIIGMEKLYRRKDGRKWRYKIGKVTEEWSWGNWSNIGEKVEGRRKGMMMIGKTSSKKEILEKEGKWIPPNKYDG